MKTSGFLIVVCLLISLRLSAQTTLDLKPDSAKIKIDPNTKVFKFDNNSQNYFPNNKSFNLNQNLAMTEQMRNFGDPNFRMPVKKPDFQSNMPVMKPDSTVHYHLLIKKIR
jgi:hypothetical protein